MYQGEIVFPEEAFRARCFSWVELYEAGVIALWTSPGRIIALSRPVLHTTEHRRGEED